MDLLRRAGLGLAFACIKAAMRAVVAVCFRRLRVIHRERFPSRGAVLLVANHPATWTDVVVLDIALGRKLHFLAHSSLYRPWARAILLALHGTLPVTPRSASQLSDRNADTFRRCHELLDRGEVIAVFPEGISYADRSVQALKTGAARIALGYPPSRAGRLAVVPVGIHYTDRTAFRTDVVVNVGEPVMLGPFQAIAAADAEAGVLALTEQVHQALTGLILNLPEPLLAAVVADLGPLAQDVDGAAELENARSLRDWLQGLRETDPVRLGRIHRHRRAYRRAKSALALGDRSLVWKPGTARWRRRMALLFGLCTVGALPAALGAVVHAVPWRLSGAIADRVAPEPTRVAFARISAGFVLFSGTYCFLVWVLISVLRISILPAFAILIAVAVLGFWALIYGRWAGELGERIRLLVLERRHPGLVRRARAERGALLELLTGANGVADGPIRPGSMEASR